MKEAPRSSQRLLGAFLYLFAKALLQAFLIDAVAGKSADKTIGED